jgi:hypothetical protein
MKTSDQFNEKYKDYLEQGHYGLDIDQEEIIEFLDKIFGDLTKIPGFTYAQIKLVFGYSRFYADGISSTMCFMIENRINQLLKDE